MSFLLLARRALKPGAVAGVLTGGSIYNHAILTSNPACCTTDASANASKDLVKNPFLVHAGLPRFSEFQPAEVKGAVEYCLNQQKKDFAELEDTFENPMKGSAWKRRRIPYDYEMVIEDLERVQAPLSYTWGVVGHLMGVKNTDDLREAHDAVQPAVVEAGQQMGQSKPLFKALTALQNTPSVWENLDEAQQRVVDANLKAMLKSGIGLDDEKRKEFNKMQLEASELSNKFSNNVLDATKQFKHVITAKADVDGLPDSALALAAEQAVKNGHPDATAENGPWLLTLDYPSYLPTMQHLKNRKVRETMYRAFVTRASSGETDNSEIIRKILTLKNQMAQLLGYKNYAELSLSSKMAPSPEAVNDLNGMLREKAYPAAVKELQVLLDFAKSKGFEGAELNAWDVPFWSERLREAKYEFEEEQLRPYFPLESVQTGLFDLAERLFSVKIEAADGDADVWHPDVHFFHIKEAATGKRIASFYLDPYSRPGDKRGGAWMDVCLQKSRALNRLPVAYLTCNGSPPVGGKPSLMTFREVETLFHEFGHGLQHMLTRVEYGDAAGIGNVEWDAVELPSQFMENWCYDKPTVYGFAKHYETGEVLPEELFKKIVAAKNFNAGMFMTRQLFFGAIDMKLHTDYDPAGEKSPFDVMAELAPLYTVVSPLPEDRFLCSFGHIFAGGYAAGYYSYMWAEVMSADAFAAFEEGNLEDEEAVRATGLRFRDTVLSMGGGKHPSKVFRAFRGRDPSPEALLKHTGLAAADAEKK